jgi:hypothetical protein
MMNAAVARENAGVMFVETDAPSAAAALNTLIIPQADNVDSPIYSPMVVAMGRIDGRHGDPRDGCAQQ